MTPAQSITVCFRKIVTFDGRASRPEYWWFFGFIIVGVYASIAVDISVLKLYPLGQAVKLVSIASLFTFVTFLPIVAVGYRRVQDTGLPGWIYLALTVAAYSQIFLSGAKISYISMAASIVTIVLCARPSQPSPNKYGPNPHEVPQ